VPFRADGLAHEAGFGQVSEGSVDIWATTGSELQMAHEPGEGHTVLWTHRLQSYLPSWKGFRSAVFDRETFAVVLRPLLLRWDPTQMLEVRRTLTGSILLEKGSPEKG